MSAGRPPTGAPSSDAPGFLPDPEAAWEGEDHLGAPDPAEVTPRIGPTAEPLELLPGGRANRNIRVGADRVLRIHTRDPSTAAKERALLERDWRNFRVPRVLDGGADFLVLEHVPHGRLEGSEAAGRQAGAALAEIHRNPYSRCGFLAPDLEVRKELSAGDFLRHLADCLGKLGKGWGELRPRALAAFQGLVADSPEIWRAVLLHGDFKASNLHRAKPVQRGASGELLVLDWEFAYAGPALMDVGQLFRWRPTTAFQEGFESGYQRGGGTLPTGWASLADVFDLVNLADLAARGEAGSRAERDIREKVRATLA